MPVIFEHVDPQPQLIDSRRIGTRIQIDLTGVQMPTAPNQMPTYNMRSDLTSVRTFKVLDYGLTDPLNDRPYYVNLKVTDDILKIYLKKAEYDRIVALQSEIDSLPPPE